MKQFHQQTIDLFHLDMDTARDRQSPLDMRLCHLVRKRVVYEDVMRCRKSKQTFRIAGTDHSIGDIQHFEPFVAQITR